MRGIRTGAAVAALAVAASVAAATGVAAPAQGGSRYLVLYGSGVSADAGRAAVAAAGGAVVHDNADVGLATVTSDNPAFVADANAQPDLAGAAADAPVGRIPVEAPPRSGDPLDLAARGATSFTAPIPPLQARIGSAEPLAGLQWDMAMLHATAGGSHALQRGSRNVLVGIIDSGIDGSHPDLAPNFDRALSRNFTKDIPEIDGPCEVASCVDPVDVDDDGHGTHVAGIVAAAINGLGTAGVAPDVTLVNLRAGQDSGFVFLQPVVDALTYAGDHGIDVVNMSFYVDPWLYNCAANPADSPAEQEQQRVTVAAIQRAVTYARAHGVTPIASEGNEHTDLGAPTVDTTSPDYPAGAAKTRPVDNASCLVVPTETDGVITVSALGPSGGKADYSNYGLEQTDVSAPGGYFRDLLGTPRYQQPGNEVLSTYPARLARINGQLNPDGAPNTPFVVRDCSKSTCAYYQYLQGTSMAAPHAAGVAALVVSQYGHRTKDGWGLAPSRVEAILTGTATPHACPDPPLVDYTLVGRTPDFNALCQGDASFNGFYGHGIVDALAAVSGKE